MSISGWSTSNYLQATTTPITATPFTLSCWVRLTATSATLRNILTICNSANTTERFTMGTAATTNVGVFAAAAGGAATQINGTTSLDTSGSIWYHIACVGTSATARELFINGVSEGTSAVSRIPSGLNQTTIGVRGGSSVNNPATNAHLSEICIRNVALSVTDILQEVNAASSLLVLPSTILAYYKMVNTTQGGNNAFASHNCATIGTLTTETHPRITCPKNPAIV